MSKTNSFVFRALTFIASLILVGLCIQTGGLLTNFIFHFLNPKALSKLFITLDLTEIYDKSQWVFYSMYSFILSIAILTTILFLEVVMMMMKMDLTNPFNSFVSDKIYRISYITFSIGILSVIARKSADYLQKHGYDTDMLNQYWQDSQAFILMAGIIYIIAVIFRKGLEIQNENELTV